MNKYDDIKEQAYKANMQLPELGLVLFTFGNASAADRNLNVFAIKLSGVHYKDLSPEKMVIVDFNGNMIEGNLSPSSDTLTHAWSAKDVVLSVLLVLIIISIYLYFTG